jgi:hypothetical protein
MLLEHIEVLERRRPYKVDKCGKIFEAVLNRCPR